MVESTAKLRQEIMALSGVDIMEADGQTFKSTYAILDELAQKWEDLSDIQQATITELIAGKRQGNIVSSLMNNFQTARDALETSLNSSGSAMREHEKWQQNLEARINKLKTSWQGLSQAFMSSDFLHIALDAVIGLVDGLTKLIDTFGMFPTLLGTFAGFKGISKIFSVSKDVGVLKSLVDILEILKRAFPNAAKGMSIFSSALKGGVGIVGILKAALSGLWSVVAAHPILAIVTAVGLAVVAYDKFTESAKELKQRIEDVTTSYREQHDALIKLKGDYNASNQDSMISKYGELSKGVDALGENISLTTDEYSEYQSIVNTIADQIPSLVTGYNSQGDAILSCAGSVDKLSESYRNLIKEQNNDVLKTGEDIFKDFKNDVKGLWKHNSDNPDLTKNLNPLNELEGLLNLSGEELEKAVANSSTIRISELLEEYGIERDVLGSGKEGYESWSEHIINAINNNREKVKKVLDEASADINAYADDLGTVTEAYFSTAFLGGDGEIGDYSHLSERMQNIINQVTTGFDSKFYADFLDDENPYESLTKYFDEMLTAFDNLNDTNTNKIETAFNLKTQFNDGEVTYGEYTKGIQEAKDIIDGLELDDEVKNTIKLSLDDEEIKTQYNHIRGYLRDFYTNKDTRKMDRDEEYDYKFKAKENDKKVEEFLNSLTSDELAAVIDIKAEIDWENTSEEDIRKQIEDKVKLNKALSFQANIEADTTALETLNEILAESASAMGLSEESIDSLKAKYSDLEGYNPHTLFEKTANGVKVNREELAKLEKKYNDLTKTEVQEHLDTLVEEYNKCTKAIDGNIDSQEKLELISKREKYAEQIEELAEYQAQLEGVTGAYQRWLDAQNAPEDYEGYQNVATSREDIKDEISRGFLSNATKEYIDLLSGEDLVGGTIDDYANAWAELDKKVTSTGHSIHDFFTVNDDGDITSTGIDRFFEDIKKDFNGEVYKLNEETGEYYYDFSQENLKAIQDEWGIGIEAIELLLEAAAAAGYDIDWGGIFDDLDLDTSNFENVEAMISLAEKAQEEFNKLKGVEDVEFNFRTNNIQDATTEVEKARKAFSQFINEDGTVNIKAEGAEQMQFMLATLLTQKQQLSTPAIMKVDTSQIDKAETDIIDVINKAKTLQTAYENYEIAIATGVDVEGAKKDLNSAIEGMQGTSVDVRADLKLPTNEELEAAKGSIGDIKIGASLDGTAIGNITTKIQTECTPEVIAKVTGLDETAIQNGSQQVVYTAEHSDVDNFINSLTDISKKIIYTYETEGKKPNPSNIKRTITYEYKTEGDVPEAYGTANANGSTSGCAFARGNWGIKGSGVALGGELGQELVVRDGKFFTIGDTGAEFFHYKPNDIVFNAAQTESLFKYGGIKGAKPRGTMLATGSAFVQGSYPSSGNAYWQATSGSKSSIFSAISSGLKKAINEVKKNAEKTKKEEKEESNKKSNNTSSNISVTVEDKSDSLKSIVKKEESDKDIEKDTENKFEDTIDWIETILDRAERAIDKYEKQADNEYKTWAKRNKALEDEIAEVDKTISLYEQAKNKYLSEANAVGLDSTYAAKVRNGSLSIQDFTDESDEKLVEKIKNYQDLYNKYLDCIDKIDELKEKEASLYSQRFDHVQSEYENLLQGFDHTQSMLDEYISQAEAKGHIVSKNYYNALIDNEEDKINTLKQEQAALIKARDEAVANDEFDKYSQDWYDMCSQIDDVTQAIESANTAIIEFGNNIRDIEWEIFDLIQQRITDITDEADFLVELLSNKDLFDDNGNFTNQGTATVGLHAQNYNTYMYQADDYGKEAAEIDKQLAKSYSKELEERRRELIELQREAILNAEQEKEAIRDLVSEGIELELEALDERIQKYQDGLDAAKDLYDYQKRVEEQTKEISSLQKQLSAYDGDNSEEAKAKIQELKVSLEEAEADLEETEYDKYISDQQKLLDELFLEYETVLNERIDNIDFLLQQVIDGINAAAGAEGTITGALGSDGVIASLLRSNTSTIGETLKTEVGNVGAKLSTAMSNIWLGDGSGKAVIDLYGKDFQGKQTTTNNVLNNIKSDVAAMVDDVDKDAKAKVETPKTQPSAQANPTNNTPKAPPANNQSSNNANTLTEDKLKGIAASIWIYGDGSGWGNDPIRSGKLTKKFGLETAKKVQSIINSQGASGELYKFWLQKNKNLDAYKYNAFKLGAKKIDESQLAWTQEAGQEYIVRPSDGAILTPVAKGDSVLTSAASSNIWQMANSPAEFIKDNLNIGSAGVPNNSTVQSSYSQTIENVVFRMDNVKNYDEMLSALQSDKNFERLVESMSLGKIAGKSSLAKGKAIR